MKTPVEIAIELVGSHKCKDESCSLVARVADGISEERLHQAKLEAELSDLRSLDRHKDKDWAKWYGLYNQKCERVVELEARVKVLEETLEGERCCCGKSICHTESKVAELEQQLAQLQEENAKLQFSLEKKSDKKNHVVEVAGLRAELAQLQLEVGSLREALEPVLEAIRLARPDFYKDKNWNPTCHAEIVLTVKECRAVVSALSHPTPPLYSAVVELVEAAKRAIERYGSLDLSESVSAVENLMGKTS